MSRYIAGPGGAVPAMYSVSRNDDQTHRSFNPNPPSAFESFIIWFLIGSLIIVPIVTIVCAIWATRPKKEVK